MKQYPIIWTAVALIAGLIVGYLVAGSGLAIVKKDFESRLEALETRIAELEAEGTDLETKLVAEQSRSRRLQGEAAMAKVQAEGVQKLVDRERSRIRDSMERLNVDNPFPISKLAAIANSFHDIQHEVAAGKYPGLSLTNGYQRLKEILDNPEMERFLADYDTARGK